MNIGQFTNLRYDCFYTPRVVYSAAMNSTGDFSSAVVILLILGICCLGLYIAFSGYVINTPPADAPRALGSPAPASTVLIVIVSTDTPSAIPGALILSPTPPPIPSPLGAFQTITAAITGARPTPTLTPRIPIAPTAPPTQLPVVGTASCANFLFCPQGGPPDARLAPTGAQCPRNYIWGQVLDANNRGIPDAHIRFKGPLGDFENVTTKGSPDPPGIYNILAPAPGGTWILWMLDLAGNRASPDISVSAPQAFSGSGSCPTRIDFVQRR